MIESQILSCILANHGGAKIVVSNGYLSRRLFALKPRNPVFYMIGSMGLALSIGLGVAFSDPKQSVVVIEGDGNLLMALGTLAMVGSRRPSNLIHILIDNQLYATTGGQPTLSPFINFSSCASASGYASTADIKEESSLVQSLKYTTEKPGPHFLRVFAQAGCPVPPRVTPPPEQIAKTFRSGLELNT